MAVLDEDGTIVAVNRAWERFAEENGGTARSCGVGANYLTVCGEAYRMRAQEAPAVIEGIREVMAGKRPEFSLEYPCHSPTQQRWFILRVTCFDTEGTQCTMITHANITERRQAEQTLRESEERYRRIVETTLEGVWVLNREFRTTYVNSQMAMMLGYSEEEMSGLTLLEFVFDEDAAWIKYNRPAGRVEISCESLSDERVRLIVRDTGVGIAPEDIPSLFTPFERLGAIHTGIEGTGLGLALSQQLATAMGGTLHAESVLGQGSACVIELPCMAPP